MGNKISAQQTKQFNYTFISIKYGFTRVFVHILFAIKTYSAQLVCNILPFCLQCTMLVQSAVCFLKSPPLLPAAKPSGPRTVRVVVGGGGGVVGGAVY